VSLYGSVPPVACKDDAEERKKQMFDLWLACHTEQEIAEAVGMKRNTINDLLPKIKRFEIPVKVGDFAEIEDDKERLEAIKESYSLRANHATDFEPPIYNIWKQQEKTSGSSHFGNSEIQWLDLFEQVPKRLLFRYSWHHANQMSTLLIGNTITG
jgi:hypothetical protein